MAVPTRAQLGSEPALLALEDLRVSFRTRGGWLRAVDGVSLRLGKGERVAIVGESGSGKSTIALATLGLLPPATAAVTGSIRFAGLEIPRLAEPEIRRLRGRRIGMVFQDPLSALNPVYTVGQQVGEMFRRHRHCSAGEARRQAIELMKRVQIPFAEQRIDDPHQFSGGMLQRAVIAIAIALSPDLLFADEPTTALDVTVGAQILDLLRRLSEEEERALVLISHDLGVVANIAQRVNIMYAGQIMETGPTREVYESPAHPYTLGLMASIPSLETRATRLRGIGGAPPDPVRLPPGCPFHPRCAFATGICRERRAELEAVAPGHSARCHRVEEVSHAA